MAELKRLVVRADAWKIFLAFVGAMLFYGIVPDDQKLLEIMASIVLVVVIFGWFLILGTSLNENLPEDQQKSDTLFVICCFYGILLVSLSAILKDVPIDGNIVGYTIVLVVAFVVSFFYMIYYTSTLYTINQDGLQETDRLSAEVIFVLFIAFIFGVLILQSRIRKFFD